MPCLIRVGRAGGAFLLVAVSLGLGACGDDDTAPDGGDAGAKDAGADDGGDHFIPRPDAQVSTGGDPVPECDRFDPLACGAGQTCRLVIRRPPGSGMNFQIYPGCVENVDALAEGEPCERFGGLWQTYEAPNLEDEVYIDPCAPGFYCAPDAKVRHHYSCQPACEPEVNVGCADKTQYCSRDNPMDTELEQYCHHADACDPRDPNSCGEGNGCYLHLNDTGDAALTVCLAVPDMPIADGEACSHYNDCIAGSSCWGPTRVPPSRWQMADLVCRRSCESGLPAEDSDAGADDTDGGTSPSGGMCPGTDRCIDFNGSGLDLTSFHGESLGQCE